MRNVNSSLTNYQPFKLVISEEFNSSGLIGDNATWIVTTNNTISVVIEGVGSGNIVEIQARILGQTNFTTVATVTGLSSGMPVDISLFDQVRFNCTTFSASGVPKLVASSFFSWVGGSLSGVSSLNSLTGAVVLSAGSNITLTPSGNTITIASTGGGGSPAGSDTQIQINDSNSFGASPSLTFDIATKNFTEGNSAVIDGGINNTAIGTNANAGYPYTGFTVIPNVVGVGPSSISISGDVTATIKVGNVVKVVMLNSSLTAAYITAVSFNGTDTDITLSTGINQYYYGPANCVFSKLAGPMSNNNNMALLGGFAAGEGSLSIGRASHANGLESIIIGQSNVVNDIIFIGDGNIYGLDANLTPTQLSLAGDVTSHFVPGYYVWLKNSNNGKTDASEILTSVFGGVHTVLTIATPLYLDSFYYYQIELTIGYTLTQNGIAIGGSNKVNASSSMAIGLANTITGSESIAIGRALTVSSDHQIKIGPSTSKAITLDNTTGLSYTSNAFFGSIGQIELGANGVITGDGSGLTNLPSAPFNTSLILTYKFEVLMDQNGNVITGV